MGNYQLTWHGVDGVCGELPADVARCGRCLWGVISDVARRGRCLRGVTN